MLGKKLLSIIISICLLTACATTALAQGSAGQISGTIADPTGARLANAQVTVTSLETALERQAVTNESGDFTVQLLPPGQYRIKVNALGFKSVALDKVVVNITQTTTLDLTLEPATQAETVTITAQPPLVQSTSSQMGRVVEERSIRQLPLPTRNFQQLLALSPGAVANLANTTELGRGDINISVNGQRTTSNNVVVNGVEINSPGTNSTPNLASPAPDSIQEFIVQTSLYDASGGRNAGGNVAAVTKSGTNEFHGNVYEFFRNRSLNANDFFLNASGQDRPVLSRNQFGATLGGPIKKDKVFFFGSYQGTRERNGASLTNSLSFLNLNFPVAGQAAPVPLTDDRSRAGLAARFGVPAASISDVSLAILNAQLPAGGLAIPSSTNAAGPTAISGISRFREDQFNANADAQLSSQNKLSGKFFFSHAPIFQALFNFLGSNAFQVPGYGGDIEVNHRILALADTHVFSSGVVNEARFGFSRIRTSSFPEEPFTAAEFGIRNPLGNLFPGLPTIGVTGAFTIGSTTLADEAAAVNTFLFADTISMVRGRHAIRAGVEGRRNQANFFFNFFSRGQLIFNTFQDFLLGRVGTSLLGSGVPDRGIRATDFNTFVQDDFRVSNRLTLNLGLRYEYFGGISDVRGRLVNFDPTQFRVGTAQAPAPPPNGIVQVSNATNPLPGVPEVGDTVNPSTHNFAPRFGFAWKAVGDDVVIRGGYGIYYDRFSTRFANSQLFNYPYGIIAAGVSIPAAGFVVPISDPFPDVPPPTAFPVAATNPAPIFITTFIPGVGRVPLAPVPITGIFVSPDLSAPYVQQYSLGVQWQLASKTMLEAAYVGSKGTKLLTVFNLNQLAPGQTVPRFPGYSTNKGILNGAQQVQTAGVSNYNSLQMSLTQRYAYGLQLLASYTFSKSIDEYSGEPTSPPNELTTLPGDQQDFRTQRGLSSFDRKHRFVTSFVYDLHSFYGGNSAVMRRLVNDWQMAGIVTLQSGLPFTVFQAIGSGIFNRADFAPGFSGSAELDGSVKDRLNKFFDTAAFVAPAGFGNSGRNILRGPGQSNVDFSVIKFIPVTEAVRAE
ncbi:MAG TPA: TonB-dependent receptor, partial [Blastocatellia bacterium]|nr:TonB-dependent receptor [Blastocatellia bacterium]